jgi:GH15 family glucan-1,4-alpha-glucosidase
MEPVENRPISFPPIHNHGVIGDRRTGALVAADGTLNWFCVPNFDGNPIFGALLDPERGGFCRFGPLQVSLGRQRYLPETAAVETSWPALPPDGGELDLTDVMAWPADERAKSVVNHRVILRRFNARGAAIVRFEARPRWNFSELPLEVHSISNGAVFRFAVGALGVCTSFPVEIQGGALISDLSVNPGDELWAMIGWDAQADEWTRERAMGVFDASLKYWRDWSAGLTIDPDDLRSAKLRRTAITAHLLSHAEHDATTAALTTSLPERIGGNRNYDYRFAWVRDASLSLALLARVGKVEEVQNYLDWLCRLDSDTDAPLQVCYRLDGDTQLEQQELSGVRGYEDSRPVQYGNHAARQRQLGSLAFFADCARIYVENGGKWQEHHWQLLRRAANYIQAHWQLAESGIWELSVQAHYVAGRVMSWVVLERAAQIARITGHGEEEEIAGWTATAQTIHAEVMEKGWSKKQNSFVQRYDSEALDAAALLIPLMEFLPADHPQVMGTLAAIERALFINGFVCRFDPAATLGGDQLPLGEFEGAFLPTTFWFAHALAKAGRADDAEAILKRCEAVAGELGLFAEEVDPHRRIFLGNTPLLFAHVEYFRAVREVAAARDRAKK